ncbi:short transient receptor potential channel 3 [Biomphalaria glabrata]|nr:short transient receptor potential channel 3 [Biomphalaria glabrata]
MTARYLSLLWYNRLLIVAFSPLCCHLFTKLYVFQKSEDCVWKFARGKLWISLIEQGTTLSIPFDIIPTPIAVVRLFRGLRTVFLINR